MKLINKYENGRGPNNYSAFLRYLIGMAKTINITGFDRGFCLINFAVTAIYRDRPGYWNHILSLISHAMTMTYRAYPRVRVDLKCFLLQ